MKTISRRQFLYRSALLSLFQPFSIAWASSAGNEEDAATRFKITVAVLKSAYTGEVVAHERYVRFSKRAVKEDYPNIAYFFTALSISEKVHADNFKRIVTVLGTAVGEPKNETLIQDTKSNLRTAAEKELIKIQKTYPGYLERLEEESHEQAVIHCMYAWKSHRQHEEKICKIEKYCNHFFGSVAKEIEGMKLDFHVCEICGSTIDEPPKEPCVICNYPICNYHRIARPTSSEG